MRYESAPIAPEVRQQTTTERAATQRRERQEELRHTASDEKRWAENRRRVISKREKAENKKEGLASYLDGAFKLMGKTRNDFKSDIPKGPHRKYYRGDLDMYPPSLPDSYPDLDERLSSIIRHTSRTSGSAGEVQSLTSNAYVAHKFAQSRGGTVYEVDASEGLFMSAGDIIFAHGDRLVNLGYIRAGTLRSAVEHFYQDGESEYFWMGRR
ncbi:hypothetical protein OPW19_03830 [Vibrio europaeus]|uniref:hypothetical protein n=1 Tax=Vibrio europaeus TaxID=300876 RepID=UPI00233F1026|nr:hypothetical protein [Vibrio europaeus]MDC5818949.1 hypothetical protein [Vibrio europaeus]MDC5871027.1 hypothetical protein [Vibrio europaeus]